MVKIRRLNGTVEYFWDSEGRWRALTCWQYWRDFPVEERLKAVVYSGSLKVQYSPLNLYRLSVGNLVLRKIVTQLSPRFQA
jgi:hypothetical protein